MNTNLSSVERRRADSQEVDTQEVHAYAEVAYQLSATSTVHRHCVIDGDWCE